MGSMWATVGLEVAASDEEGFHGLRGGVKCVTLSILMADADVVWFHLRHSSPGGVG